MKAEGWRSGKAHTNPNPPQRNPQPLRLQHTSAGEDDALGSIVVATQKSPHKILVGTCTQGRVKIGNLVRTFAAIGFTAISPLEKCSF